jgi:hypothetical protein
MSDATISAKAQTASHNDSETPRLPSSPLPALLGLMDRPALQLWLFGATMFASALLLFSVQPMFAKMALPKLGGAPAVWAVSMCFFQAALLAGYCYAHCLNRYLAPRLGVFVHLTLLVVTLVALPIGLPSSLSEPPTGDAYLWLLGVLTLGVGLPFFAVSANAPLLQAWFARTGHAQADDPYFLYGASNLGSLLALLAYPLVVEPALGATAQAQIWSAGFMGLALLIAASGVAMVWLHQRQLARSTGAPVARVVTPAKPITQQDRALWTVLAMIPSGLMVAVTTYVTTDIASAPFLWVVPLALFLATFILVFKERLAWRHDLLAYILPLVVLCLQIAPSHGQRLALAMVAFFVAALVCHRELYLCRPAAQHLTEFYLWMSAGGVLGGVFSALLAPQIFATVFEFNVLLIAALFCVPGLLFQAPVALDYRRVIGMGCLAIAMLVLVLVGTEVWGGAGRQATMVALLAGIVVAIIAARAWPEQRAIFMMGVACIVLSMSDTHRAVYAERSFFGTVRVVDGADGQHRYMLHGTTLHGARRLMTDDGKTLREAQPATYYEAAGPMARGFAAARAAKAAALPLSGDVSKPQRLLAGVVGLGTGSLACYAAPGDAFRYYEIDPVVVRIARDPALFDFMSRCTPNAPVILGDARLALLKEPDDAFDYLIIDAFSSDSVPVHLITVEALQLYLSKLSETGLIALHISNRHMDLPAAVAATLNEIPGVHSALVLHEVKKGNVDSTSSNVVFVSRNAKTLEQVLKWPDTTGLPRTSVRAWTDDYSDVLSAVLRMVWR